MAVIPAGPFYFGKRGGVRLESARFSLARYPVTNAQWFEFVRDTQYLPPAGHPDPNSYLSHWVDDKPRGVELDHPVVWISFLDALHYVQWAGLGIPSEWCWEKAARGTEGQTCPWGDGSYLSQFKEIVHVARKRTASVDAYPLTRTAFGCEQMIGNVSEFCIPVEKLDVKEALSETGLCLETPPPDYMPAENLIALRGSCFLRIDPVRMVCSHRRRLSAGRRNRWTGLRVGWFGTQ